MKRISLFTVLYFEAFCYVLGASSLNDIALFRRKRQNSASVDNSILEVFNQCQCVPYFQCDENNFIITDGSNLIEERAGSPQRIICKGGTYEGYFLCCKVKPELREPQIVSTTSRPRTTGGSQKTTQRTISTDGTTITSHENKPNNQKNMGGRKPRSCGTQLPLIDVRISTGGDEPAPMSGEFPWLTAIYLKKHVEWSFKCAGSLIHPKVILTVNHCVRIYQSLDLKVALNPTIDRKPIGMLPHMERNVDEIIKHPDYNAGSLRNDIALLILNEAYDINNRSLRVNSICFRPKISTDNRRCLVAGWGKEVVTGDMSSIWKKVEVPVLQHHQCQDMLRHTRLGVNFQLDKSFICAGGEKNKDSCKGDGGGPLMCPPDNGANNGMFVAGLVSWGIGCGQENVPGVYTNVAHFYEWITSELSSRNIQV